MKSKRISIAVIIVLACLLFCGFSACVSSPAPVPSDTVPSNQPNTGTQSQTQSENVEKDQVVAEDQITTVAQELNAKLSDLDFLLFSPEIDNDEWISNITLVLTDITTLCEQAYQIVDADSMTDDQAVFIEAVTNIDDAVDTLMNGIDTRNLDLIDQASAEIWLAGELLTQTSE